jgi:hypothetical protein
MTELVKNTESPLLFLRSSRVYYWVALTGNPRGLGRRGRGIRSGMARSELCALHPAALRRYCVTLSAKTETLSAPSSVAVAAVRSNVGSSDY